MALTVELPKELTTDQARMDYVLALREKLRRWNNETVAGMKLADAQKWHRENFLPQNAAITDLELQLRDKLWPGPSPIVVSETIQPSPWTDRETAIRSLSDTDKALADIDLKSAFSGLAVAQELPDPTEDFTTFTKTDPNNRYTVSATTLTITNIASNEDDYLLKDYTANHFGATFTHDMDANITSASNNYWESGLWCVTNFVDDVYGLLVSAKQALYSLGGKATGTGAYFTLYNAESGLYANSNYTGTYQMGTTYYLRHNRTGETEVQLIIYSDTGRTSVIETLSLAITTGRRYRYVEVGSSNRATQSRTATLSVANLDLHEAVAGQPASKRFGGIPFAALNQGVW